MYKHLTGICFFSKRKKGRSLISTNKPYNFNWEQRNKFHTGDHIYQNFMTTNLCRSQLLSKWWCACVSSSRQLHESVCVWECEPAMREVLFDFGFYVDHVIVIYLDKYYI